MYKKLFNAVPTVEAVIKLYVTDVNILLPKNEDLSIFVKNWALFKLSNVHGAYVVLTGNAE